jgi:hypothetical protein
MAFSVARPPRPQVPRPRSVPPVSKPAPRAEVDPQAIVEYLAKLSDEERDALMAKLKRPEQAAVATPSEPPPARVTEPPTSAVVVAAVESVVEEPPRENFRATLNSADMEVVPDEHSRVTRSPPPLPPGARRSIPTPIMAMPPSLLALASLESTEAAVGEPAAANETDALTPTSEQAIPFALVRPSVAPAPEAAPSLAPAPSLALAPVALPHPPPRPSLPELTDSLFDAMHELSFFDTAVEGASYCLATVLRLLPSLGGMVHLSDPDTRELVVVYAQGPRSERLLLSRVPDTDRLVAAAARKGAPLVVEYNESTPAAPRHAHFGDPWSALVAPVVIGGRCLAVIELVDPLDGSPFDDVSQGALAYVAERYAEYLRERDIVLKNVVAVPAELVAGE